MKKYEDSPASMTLAEIDLALKQAQVEEAEAVSVVRKAQLDLRLLRNKVSEIRAWREYHLDMERGV